VFDTAGNTSTAATQAVVLDTTAPTITSAATATSIDENSGAGQVIYTVTSTDDVGVGSYSLSGTDAGSFTIDGSTGAVTLKTDPNFEGKSSYAFTVTATDAAGNTGDKAVSLAINDVEPEPVAVVFDLVGGMSSSHSSRTFDAGTDYVIYIKVDSTTNTLNTTIPSGSGTWGKWSGAENLGSDDKIVLVGSGTDILGRTTTTATSITSITAINATIVAGTGRLEGKMDWHGAITINKVAEFQDNGLFSRVTGNGEVENVDLWDSGGTGPDMRDFIGTGTQLWINTMPVGILTSQGLV